MGIYTNYAPKLIKLLYPELIWDKATGEKRAFLTFDDGPTPEVTPWVLDQLDKHQIKATFFCIGKNIVENPEIFQDILKRGHRVGNHTHNHLNGWKFNSKEYLKNILTAADFIPQSQGKLFRPPYGRIKKSQIRKLDSLGYEIVMWSILSGDWDKKTSPEQCVKNCTYNLDKGNVLVFHDSRKAEKNLKGSLEKVILHLKEKEYSFDIL
jgi:peptidoglycan/xylan/chitin deacetylase (PgdA/CDA1 family)